MDVEELRHLLMVKDNLIEDLQECLEWRSADYNGK